MKKIYFMGDVINDTGPAIVNKSYLPYIKKNIYYSRSNNKIYRVLHFLLHLIFINKILLSGFSKINILLISIANKMGKKTIYLMHGLVKEESLYDPNDNSLRIREEYNLLEKADKIICVSSNFSQFLITIYPEFKDKVTYVNNGPDNIINPTKQISSFDFRLNNQIISVGGGNRIKNILRICEALESIGFSGKFIVVGQKSTDYEAIISHDFVEYYINLTRGEVISKMKQSALYIQNSYFETFGLAVVESIEAGCNILISKNIGALSIIDNISDKDIILDPDDVDEIANKIKMKLNEDHITNVYIDSNKHSWERSSERLLKIIEEL